MRKATQNSDFPFCLRPNILLHLVHPTKSLPLTCILTNENINENIVLCEAERLSDPCEL